MFPFIMVMFHSYVAVYQRVNSKLPSREVAPALKLDSCSLVAVTLFRHLLLGIPPGLICLNYGMAIDP